MSTVACSTGVYDCDFRDIPSGESCANYDGDYKDMEGRLWILVTSCLVMCAMAFGMGSNDAANSWGTSVGSGAISLRAAVMTGALMEFLGAVTLGYGVSDTIQKGVSDIEDENCWACGFCDSQMSVYQTGMFGALISTAIFLLLSSFTSMPVSATHAVVGGVVGMTWAGVGGNCLNWEFDGLGGIFASWVISPLLSGLIGAATYILTEKFIFQTNYPRERAIVALPVFITIVSFVISFLVCLKSPMTKELDISIQLTAAACVGVFAFVIAMFILLPWAKANLPSVSPNYNTDTIEDATLGEEEERPSRTSLHITSPIEESLMTVTNTKAALIPAGRHTAPVEQIKDAMFCFRILLVCNAALESFAHGANDTANCTGPFRAVFQIYQHGLDSCHDAKGGEWIMVLAGLFVALGVVTFGKNVIETVGKHLTLIDYQRGFCIEFSSCVTVVLATMLELPVSTTHCQIGAVVLVGLVSMGREHVAWRLVGKIFLTWVITLPFSGAISISIMEMIRASIKR